MRSMLARVGPMLGPQIAVRPRAAGVVRLPAGAPTVTPVAIRGYGRSGEENESFRPFTHMIVYRSEGVTRSGGAWQIPPDPSNADRRPWFVVPYKDVTLTIYPEQIIAARPMTAEEALRIVPRVSYPVYPRGHWRNAGLAAGAGVIDDVREAQEKANRKLLIGGAVVVGLGLLAYFATRKRSRKNPVISNGDRRFFAQPDAAVKYLNDGFSVVGKTSSSRRRRRAAK